MQNPQDPLNSNPTNAEEVSSKASIPEGAGEEKPEETVSLAALQAAEAKVSELQDAFLRAKAEGENIRRRAQEDVMKASKFASERFAQSLLAVKDSLEAALSNERITQESLYQGVELTLKQLQSAFQSAQIVEENPLAQKFDPNKHQAISAQEDDGEPNRVLQVLQKGYLLHDRVIRPAMVIVSKAKSST